MTNAKQWKLFFNFRYIFPPIGARFTLFFLLSLLNYGLNEMKIKIVVKSHLKVLFCVSFPVLCHIYLIYA
jgi:hypothetical protein